MCRIDRRTTVALSLFAAVWIACEAGGVAAHSGLLHLAPVLLLALPLLRGRYVGERRLVAALGRGPRRRPMPLAAMPTGRRGGLVALARGGALLGSGIARRPPPAQSSPA